MRTYQASVWKEGALFVAQCLDVDVASQGSTADDALANLREAVELFLETASPQEVQERLREGVTVAPFEVAIG
ncbi:MAG: type II toxin-antitoxin system HicB family antitoxin [Candidatus Sumerlaeia bacterium]|nr:type II toxin-antitoxin system HicB family antitoxin [Candidatus Sumerlaeia bacterium]